VLHRAAVAGDVAGLQPAVVGEVEVGLRAVGHRAMVAASDNFLSHAYGLADWSR
jgi:hypothetical protein